jgi:UDP-N-acetylglucosamine 2-epimerase (non-hydrolysing)
MCALCSGLMASSQPFIILTIRPKASAISRRPCGGLNRPASKIFSKRESLSIMKVMPILGTRPEAVKLAPVIKALADHPRDVDLHICVTAQHREILDQALALFKIHPDVDMDLMRQRQTPTQIASLVLQNLAALFQEEKPDWVLVQGDTTTVMASTIAAVYAKVKVGHVEAGLRTYDKAQPFPEEINRRIAGAVADRHFAPTQRACDNLLSERVAREDIVITGNTVIDALHMASAMHYDMGCGPLKEIPFGKRIILITAHRREAFGDPVESICMALKEIAASYDDVHIVYPVHPNPHIAGPVHEMLGGLPGITLLPPLDYLPFVQLMKRCTIVLTDSGGIQEEAPSLGKPVLVLREITERPEAVSAGTARLVGTDKEKIIRTTAKLLEDEEAYQQMAQSVNPYGDGKAARRIVDSLLGKPVDEMGAGKG